jgi:hypothetical protein
VIILKSGREDYWDEKELLQYPETNDTRKLREQVERLNTWLASADIRCTAHHIDSNYRRMRRIFNNSSFEQGGRLFGGFWQPLSKADRKRWIRINGNPVTSLDFGQIAPRIVYGTTGVPLHFVDDAYQLPLKHGLSQHREGVKRIFNAMLCTDERFIRYPRGTRKLIPKKSIKVDHVQDAILDYHRPIADMFFKGYGLNIMLTESKTLLTILGRLMLQNIVALPVHDALIVEQSNALYVMELMQTTFKELIGVDIPVTHDDGIDRHPLMSPYNATHECDYDDANPSVRS